MKITAISQIDANGEGYISGLLEEEKFNKQGLWHGIKAFSIDLNYKKNKSKVCTFIWNNGAVCNYKVVKEIKDEIIGIEEVEKILKDCNLIIKKTIAI